MKNLKTLLTFFLLFLINSAMAFSQTTVKRPVRIASGTIASDEILWAILKEAKRTKDLIAVSILADNPEYSHITDFSKNVPYRIGGNLESMIKTKADLLILSNFNRPQLIKQAEDAGIKTFILAPFTSIEDIRKSIQTIGRLIDQEQAAKKILDRFDYSLASFRSIAIKSDISVLGWNQDGTSMAEKTLFHSVLKHMGIKNTLSTLNLKGWPKVSAESLALLRPDYLIVGGHKEDSKKIWTYFSKHPAARLWPAFKNKKLLIIPTAHLSAASPFIIKTLEELKKALIDQQSATERPKNKKGL